MKQMIVVYALRHVLRTHNVWNGHSANALKSWNAAFVIWGSHFLLPLLPLSVKDSRHRFRLQKPAVPTVMSLPLFCISPFYANRLVQV